MSEKSASKGSPKRPSWAEELVDSYLAGASSVFLISGNVHDLIPAYGSDGRPEEYLSVEQYLADRLFGTRQVVVQYDRGVGVTFLAHQDPDRRASMRRDFIRMLSALDTIHGTSYASSVPKDPARVLELLDRYILHKLAGEGGASLALILRYTETLVPAVDTAWLSGEVGSNLVKILNWANEPSLRSADITICLLAEKISDLNRRLVENPFITKIEVPLPDEIERKELVDHLLEEESSDVEIDGELVSREANGLPLVGVSRILRRALRSDPPGDLTLLKKFKKSLIEKECYGLVEFVDPDYNLDMLVAQTAVKERLEQDALLIREARHHALPMGYLICGVLGTGKTFTAKCFAGTIGIPALIFKNLRERWVGASEGNLQKVLSVVRALGPVVVIVDEADAALGRRSSGGDSGTSGRMFAMISSQMSDTAYRGKVIWMLLTCRPDLIPVDLKRQGRCEVHIPLFAPQTVEQQTQMFSVLARKNGVEVSEDDIPRLAQGLSGSDIESIVVQCRRRAALERVAQPTPEMLQEVASTFVSPAYALEKDLQRLVAIRESTNLAFLPDAYRGYLEDPEENAEMEERIQDLMGLVGHR